RRCSITRSTRRWRPTAATWRPRPRHDDAGTDAGATAMNWRTTSLPRLFFLAVFVVPTAAVFLYEYLVASDRYESTAAVYITEERAQNSLLDLSLLGITNSGSARDILVLKAFIESRAM